MSNKILESEYQNLKEKNRSLGKKLTLKQEQYKKLFKHIKSGVMIYQFNHKQELIIKNLNPAAEKINQIDKEKVIGQKIIDIFPKAEKFGFISALIKAWHTEEVVKFRNRKYHDSRISGVRNNSIYKLSNGDLVSVFTDVKDKKDLKKEINHLNYHDRLTGLYNRNYYEEVLASFNEINKLPISMIVGDINGLKLVNDTFGHQSGDKLLKKTAQIFKKSCREDDIVIRWGGDEFLIILPKTERSIAKKVKQRITYLSEKSKPNPIKPSIALGVAERNSLEKDFNSLFTKAEDNMYRDKLMTSKSVKKTIISTLEQTLMEKNFETEAHIRRIQKIILAIETELGLSGKELDNLFTLAALHDIGKIAIPDEILLKPDKLSPGEWKIIKKHPETGYRIAKSSFLLSDIANYILTHHEHWDGSGYPRGLKGKEIPYLARIITIIDAYDVMTHKRVYKSAYSHQEAITELKRCAGSQFDPHLVNIFISHLNKKDRQEIKA